MQVKQITTRAVDRLLLNTWIGIVAYFIAALIDYIQRGPELPDDTHR